ncbi:unnamed protein product [Aureobasidium mustum]|uniref:Uncharacterized protein n=1 Tax=Aureobasidium mustum TaxID=2773714 RepID=A0A9N8PNL4_9PEZI|nr:unnamed protein product [Aureobasidium mustum]
MKLSTVFAAAMALMMPAAVFGQNIGDPVITSVLVVEYVPAVSTSTVYQTTQFTVWSCPPDVTNCPLRSATSLAMVTAIVGMSTTICPVTFVSTRVSSYTTPASTSYASSSPGATVSSASVISTTYSTGSSTITIGSSTTSWSFWSTISYSATSTPSVVTSQATLYSGGPSLPTGVTDISTSASTSAGASAGSGGSGLASASASAISSASAGVSSAGIPSASSISSASASVFNPAGASSSSAATAPSATGNAASASAIVTTSIAANDSSYTISYSPLGTGSLSSQVVSGPGSTNNISAPSGPTGSGPLPTYTGMAGREAVMTAFSALAFGMVAALVLV